MPGIHTASRLHFGLFHLGDEGHWPNCDGELVHPARRFGGVGLMVRDPGIRLWAEPSSQWYVEGPLAERVLKFARTFAQNLAQFHPGMILSPHRFVVESAPPEHVGFGVGTQLGLAVASALADSLQRAWDTVHLAQLVGRGLRSALGVHGFERGGFLVEGGKRADEVSPLLCRVDFPEEWPILLLCWNELPGLHGNAERRAFAELAKRSSLARTDALCRLLLLGMLPALVERDCQAFGEALYDFNRRVGEIFAPTQHSVYAHSSLEQLIAWLRGQGIRGVGQSSWGPTLFAIGDDDEKIRFVEKKLAEHPDFSVVRVMRTRACNRGRVRKNVPQR